MDSTQLNIELSRIVGAKILGLTTATATRLNKTNGERKRADKRLNPFSGRVISVRNSTYQPNYDYAGAVDRARAKADVGGEPFEAGETWYERISDAKGRSTAFCRHKETGVVYFVGRELHKGETTYVATEDIIELSDDADNQPTGRVLYRAGETIPVEVLRPWMPPYRPSAKQGLEAGDEVKARTLKLSSIRGIRIEGQREVIDPSPERAEVREVVNAINGIMATMPDIDIGSIPIPA